MDHWQHITPEQAHSEGFTRLKLEPEDIKPQVERLPVPPEPRPLEEAIVRLRERLSTLATPANAAEIGLSARQDQNSLPSAETDAFKDAVRKLVSDGTYARLINVHADMSHNMHGSMGPVGLLRFLGWHRRYILEFERALTTADRVLRPNATTPMTLPTWHWSDPFPTWLDGFLPANRPDNNTTPPTRRKQSPPEKPSQPDIEYVINGFAAQLPGVNTDAYTRFTYGLEGWGRRQNGTSLPAHNHIHDWTGGVMSNVRYSPTDPVFWLHHAEVDRLWHVWQQQQTSAHPALTGSDRIMDPWAESYDDIRAVEALGYTYASVVP